MFVPPVTQDLWPVLRNRANSATMQTILGGANRVVVEGDYDGPPGPETSDWKLGVIVPVVPIQGTRWEQGLPMTVRWLFRIDMNNIASGGLRASVWASRTGELAQREVTRLWQNWDGASALNSTQIMFASPPRLDEVWQSRVLFDPDRTGTVFMSSSWLADVASAAD